MYIDLSLGSPLEIFCFQKKKKKSDRLIVTTIAFTLSPPSLVQNFTFLPPMQEYPRFRLTFDMALPVDVSNIFSEHAFVTSPPNRWPLR